MSLVGPRFFGKMTFISWWRVDTDAGSLTLYYCIH